MVIEDEPSECVSEASDSSVSEVSAAYFEKMRSTLQKLELAHPSENSANLSTFTGHLAESESDSADNYSGKED